jgi:hypothetical protein
MLHSSWIAQHFERAFNLHNNTCLRTIHKYLARKQIELLSQLGLDYGRPR